MHEDFGVELNQAAYALDSTTIDLCLAVFPWAHFRKHKAAIKLHTLLDLKGNLPVSITVTTGKVHDVNLLDQMTFEPGSIYIFDRGYLDFLRLYRVHLSNAFFITRASGRRRPCGLRPPTPPDVRFRIRRFMNNMTWKVSCPAVT